MDMTARVLRRRRPLRGADITGVCPVCAISFVRTAAGGLFPHGPTGLPRCPGSGLHVEPERFDTPLATIRAAETRLRRLPEWQRLPLQPSEET
jgi:hypothetical protein